MATIDELRKPYLERLRERQVQQVDTQSQEEVYIPSEAEVQAQQDYENQLAQQQQAQQDYEAIKNAQKMYDKGIPSSFLKGTPEYKYLRQLEKDEKALDQELTKLTGIKDLPVKQKLEIYNKTVEIKNQLVQDEINKLEAQGYLGQSTKEGYTFSKPQTEVKPQLDLQKKYDVIQELKPKPQDVYQKMQETIQERQMEVRRTPKNIVKGLYDSGLIGFNNPLKFYENKPYRVGPVTLYGGQSQASSNLPIIKDVFAPQNVLTTLFFGPALATSTSGIRTYNLPPVQNKFVGRLNNNKLEIFGVSKKAVTTYKGQLVENKGSIGDLIVKGKKYISYNELVSSNMPIKNARVNPPSYNPLLKETIKDANVFISQSASRTLGARKLPGKTPIEVNQDIITRNTQIGFVRRLETIPSKNPLIATKLNELAFFVESGRPIMRIYKSGEIKYFYKPTSQGVIRVKAQATQEGVKAFTPEQAKAIQTTISENLPLVSLPVTNKPQGSVISELFKKSGSSKPVTPLLINDNSQLFVNPQEGKDKNIFIQFGDSRQGTAPVDVQGTKFIPIDDVGSDIVKGNDKATKPQEDISSRQGDLFDKANINDQITGLRSTVGKLQEKKTIKDTTMRDLLTGIPNTPPPERPKPPRKLFDKDSSGSLKKKQLEQRFLDSYKVFIKRFGKDQEVLKTSNLAEAKDFLKSRLSRTLARSGFITSGGSKVKVDLGSMFRPSKKDIYRTVQKSQFSLSAPSEKREIQLFRKKKKKRGFSLWG